MNKEIEIILMDENFNRMKVIRDFTSLLWTERYYEQGGFEMHLPPKYIDNALNTMYVFRKDKTETGMVTRFIKNEEEIVLKGDFLSSLLKTRVLNSSFKYNGSVFDAARALVNNYCINCESERKIERLKLGSIPETSKSVSLQISGKTVYDALREILSEQEASFLLRYDIYSDTLYFDIVKGADRTSSQTQNSWCVFSKEYYNLLSEKYEYSEDKRNFAYVVSGAPENVEPMMVSVSLVSGKEKRRELYVDAKDLWRNSVSDTELNSLLHERGLQKLADYNEGETIECEVDMNRMGNMVFELGDKCSYTNSEMGVAAEGRVTEIAEVYESNEISTCVTLGKEQLDLIRKIKRGII